MFGMFSFSNQLEFKSCPEEAEEMVFFLLKIQLTSLQINTEDMDDTDIRMRYK